MSVLQIEDLHVWFDLSGERELHAVQGVSLGVDEGERFGLVGESGSGKTTTILAVMGLLPPSASVGTSVLGVRASYSSSARFANAAMAFSSGSSAPGGNPASAAMPGTVVSIPSNMLVSCVPGASSRIKPDACGPRVSITPISCDLCWLRPSLAISL